MLTESLEKMIDKDASSYVVRKSHLDILIEEQHLVTHSMFDVLMQHANNAQQVVAAKSWLKQTLSKTDLYLRLKKKFNEK